MLKRFSIYSFFYAPMAQKSTLKVKKLKIMKYIIAQFKKIVALSNLIQRIYHNDIRNMPP